MWIPLRRNLEITWPTDEKWRIGSFLYYRVGYFMIGGKVPPRPSRAHRARLSNV
jgi:hypothetical protein